MSRAAVAIASCFLAAITCASADWIGMTFTPGSAGAAGVVQLAQLGLAGQQIKVIGSVSVGNQTVKDDAFRCKPYGTHCIFLANDDTAQTSTLYNVSQADASLIQATHFPGIAYNLHVDHTTAAAYTILYTTAPKRAVVTSILQGVVEPLVDISATVGAGTIHPGGSTQCSDDDYMWIGVDNGGSGDKLVTVSLSGRQILSTMTLQFPVFVSLWASCDNNNDANNVGGVVVLNDTMLAYGTVDSNGQFVEESTVKLPTGYFPTPLLSWPPLNDYFSAVYPKGATGGATSGYLALGNFQAVCCGSMKLVPVSYYLTGAALVS